MSIIILLFILIIGMSFVILTFIDDTFQSKEEIQREEIQREEIPRFYPKNPLSSKILLLYTYIQTLHLKILDGKNSKEETSLLYNTIASYIYLIKLMGTENDFFLITGKSLQELEREINRNNIHHYLGDNRRYLPLDSINHFFKSL